MCQYDTTVRLNRKILVKYIYFTTHQKLIKKNNHIKYKRSFLGMKIALYNSKEGGR